MPTNVQIAGRGPAALEAALALRRLAGEPVTAADVAAPASPPMKIAGREPAVYLEGLEAT